MGWDGRGGDGRGWQQPPPRPAGGLAGARKPSEPGPKGPIVQTSGLSAEGGEITTAFQPTTNPRSIFLLRIYLSVFYKLFIEIDDIAVPGEFLAQGFFQYIFLEAYIGH